MRCGIAIAALWIKWSPALWKVDRLVAHEETERR
jgi:hypothetical protein